MMAEDTNGYLAAELHSPAMTEPDISHGDAPRELREGTTEKEALLMSSQNDNKRQRGGV